MFIILYVCSLIVAYIAFFAKSDLSRYKKILIRIHLVSLFFCSIALLLNISSDYSFYGAWTLPFLSVCLIISGLFLFVLYARSANLLMKIYGGIYFSYPLLIILATMLSRMMLGFGLGLTFLVLNVPDNFYKGKGLVIREGFSGVLAASQKIVLYKSCFPLLKEIGTASLRSENMSQLNIDSIQVQTMTADRIVIKTEPEHRKFTFYKSFD